MTESLLPVHVDDHWLALLCEGWSIAYMGLLLPWGATRVLWLVRYA